MTMKKVHQIIDGTGSPQPFYRLRAYVFCQPTGRVLFARYAVAKPHRLQDWLWGDPR
jgi:hypothetical protein